MAVVVVTVVLRLKGEIGNVVLAVMVPLEEMVMGAVVVGARSCFDGVNRWVRVGKRMLLEVKLMVM